MAGIKSREQHPVPGIEYSEILIPDESNPGTGLFTTVIEANAMAKMNPIISTIVNKPIFKLMVNINLATEEVTAALGRADDTPARSRAVFRIPKVFRTSDAHAFQTIFKNWKVRELKMDGSNLELVSE